MKTTWIAGLVALLAAFPAFADRFVSRLANGRRSHSFKVTNEMCGDPAHGARKTLEVTYYCGQVLKTASAREHQDVYLNCHTP